MKLGLLLKSRRELQGLTLRQVEESVGISNAYLSQLENGKIKKPSANVLYKLSVLYCVPLDELLIASGIIDKGQTITYDPAKKTFNGIELTDEEEQQLLMYLQFLRHGKSVKDCLRKDQSK